MNKLSGYILQLTLNDFKIFQVFSPFFKEVPIFAVR